MAPITLFCIDTPRYTIGANDRLSRLPAEMIVEVMAHFDPATLATFQRTNRFMKNVVETEGPRLIRKIQDREDQRHQEAIAPQSYRGLSLEQTLRKAVARGGIPKSKWEFMQLARGVASVVNAHRPKLFTIEEYKSAWYEVEAMLIVDRLLHHSTVIGRSPWSTSSLERECRFRLNLGDPFGFAKRTSSIAARLLDDVTWNRLYERISAQPLQGRRMSQREKDLAESKVWSGRPSEGTLEGEQFTIAKSGLRLPDILDDILDFPCIGMKFRIMLLENASDNIFHWFWKRHQFPGLSRALLECAMSESLEIMTHWDFNRTVITPAHVLQMGRGRAIPLMSRITMTIGPMEWDLEDHDDDALLPARNNL